METLEEKSAALTAFLRKTAPVAIAYSGGVDSTMLLKAALEAVGSDKVLALTADTPTVPRRELAAALALAARLGARCVPVKTDETSAVSYRQNPPERCYYCKRRIFTMLLHEARARGFLVMLDGNNADDYREDRPGHRAAVELGVRSPLQDAGLTKADIRELSRRFGLPTADKPALACLATRIPTGQPITEDKLARVEKAEDILHEAGFPACRVRHDGGLARIEVAPADFPRLISPAVRGRLVPALLALGFRRVTLDLSGYASPSAAQ
jgi:uncharacterized protein